MRNDSFIVDTGELIHFETTDSLSIQVVNVCGFLDIVGDKLIFHFLDLLSRRNILAEPF